MAGTLCAGYLPIIGPSPLRFESARPKIVPLPPLDMGRTEVPGVSNIVLNQVRAIAPTNSISHTNTLIAGAPPPPAPETNSVAAGDTNDTTIAISPLPLTETKSPNSMITPQMLVQFFKPSSGSTNGTGVSVVVPLDATTLNTLSTPSLQGGGTNQ